MKINLKKKKIRAFGRAQRLVLIKNVKLQV